MAKGEPTDREQAAIEAATALDRALYRLFGPDYAREWGHPESAGNERKGSLRVEMYLSPERTAELAAFLDSTLSKEGK